MPDLRITLDATAEPHQATSTATSSGTATAGAVVVLVPDGMTNATLRRTLGALLDAVRRDPNAYRG